MHEIELKFGLPASQLDALRAELARLGADIARPQILQAAYFDTPDRRLAQARARCACAGKTTIGCRPSKVPSPNCP